MVSRAAGQRPIVFALITFALLALTVDAKDAHNLPLARRNGRPHLAVRRSSACSSASSSASALTEVRNANGFAATGSASIATDSSILNYISRTSTSMADSPTITPLAPSSSNPNCSVSLTPSQVSQWQSWLSQGIETCVLEIDKTFSLNGASSRSNGMSSHSDRSSNSRSSKFNGGASGSTGKSRYSKANVSNARTSDSRSINYGPKSSNANPNYGKSYGHRSSNDFNAVVLCYRQAYVDDSSGTFGAEVLVVQVGSGVPSNEQFAIDLVFGKPRLQTTPFALGVSSSPPFGLLSGLDIGNPQFSSQLPSGQTARLIGSYHFNLRTTCSPTPSSVSLVGKQGSNIKTTLLDLSAVETVMSSEFGLFGTGSGLDSNLIFGDNSCTILSGTSISTTDNDNTNSETNILNTSTDSSNNVNTNTLTNANGDQTTTTVESVTVANDVGGIGASIVSTFQTAISVTATDESGATAAEVAASSIVTVPTATAVHAAAAAASTTAIQMPGRQLSVLPIGLGVFAGVSVLALIIVGTVTFERRKYRKAFRNRKMAEQISEATGYGGTRMGEVRV